MQTLGSVNTITNGGPDTPDGQEHQQPGTNKTNRD